MPLLCNFQIEIVGIFQLSAKEQKTLNISDRRNVNDYIETMMHDDPTAVPGVDPAELPSGFLDHLQQHQSKRAQQRLRCKVYRCKANGCDYSSEVHGNLLKHCQAIHSSIHSSSTPRHSTPIKHPSS